jgi:uncharacterized protein (DUF427 family)
MVFHWLKRHSNPDTTKMSTATATLKSNSSLLASADSSNYAKVEGNIYFAPSTLTIPSSQLEVSGTHTTCPWKGKASYYNIILEDGTKVKDAAWFYPEPFSKAEGIKDYVAFCEWFSLFC